MNRRKFLGAFIAAIVLPPLRAPAQVLTKRRPLIAVLVGGSSKTASRWLMAFPQGMKELGYVEERDFEITYRYADGDLTRLPALASELVQLNPDVIVTVASAAAIATKQQTARIPIVVAAIADPAALGLVVSQARPGGNVTGILVGLDSLIGKQLELGLELAPGAERVGMLVNVSNPANSLLRAGPEAAAAMKSINLIPAEVHAAADIDAAFQVCSHVSGLARFSCSPT